MGEEQTTEELSKQERIDQILANIKDLKERAEKLRILESYARLWQKPDGVQGVTEQEKTPLTGK